MIPLSAAAQARLDALTAYYAERGRDQAIEKLAVGIERACGRYQARSGPFYEAPRPYPALSGMGFRWIKEGSYWFAFAETKDGQVIAGIFHESADISNRL